VAAPGDIVVDVEDDSLPFRDGPTGPEPPATIVIFGATGDLTSRKVVPALFELSRAGYLAPETAVVGAARRVKSTDGFRAEMAAAIRGNARTQPVDDADLALFLRRVHYQPLEFEVTSDYAALKELLETPSRGRTFPRKSVAYLATSPAFFPVVTHNLREAGLLYEPGGDPWSRVVFEKPFGRDLESARALNRQISECLAESQVCRIDHYLGKDTVQNLLAFRFGNGLFEPIFNRRYVDHVQVTVAEDQGIEGARGAFYDQTGALRDVVQNHVLQLLCLVAMEPPSVCGADEIRAEKVKVLQALRAEDATTDWAVRGQYGEGPLGRAYRDEDRIAAQSATETYAAMRVYIENWRWAGVPFLLRTGKRMPVRRTEIVVVFRRPPTQLFRTVRCVGDVCRLTAMEPNLIVFRIQPDEGVLMDLMVKRPGMNMDLHRVTSRFYYREAFPQALPDAYERLLVDVIRGDQTLFTHSTEIERAWAFLTPLLDYWSAVPPRDFPNYAAGSWGPSAADRLFDGLAGHWRNTREP